jgi:hypothetical protein
MPTTRAKSLPRPPGQHADDGARDLAQRTGDRAEHPVAAERHHDAPAPRRR